MRTKRGFFFNDKKKKKRERTTEKANTYLITSHKQLMRHKLNSVMFWFSERSMADVPVNFPNVFTVVLLWNCSAYGEWEGRVCGSVCAVRCVLCAGCCALFAVLCLLCAVFLLLLLFLAALRFAVVCLASAPYKEPLKSGVCAIAKHELFDVLKSGSATPSSQLATKCVRVNVLHEHVCALNSQVLDREWVFVFVCVCVCLCVLVVWCGGCGGGVGVGVGWCVCGGGGGRGEREGGQGPLANPPTQQRDAKPHSKKEEATTTTRKTGKDQTARRKGQLSPQEGKAKTPT